MAYNNREHLADLVVEVVAQNQDKLQEVQELELEILVELMEVPLQQMDGVMMVAVALQVLDILAAVVGEPLLTVQPQEILVQLVVLEVMD